MSLYLAISLLCIFPSMQWDRLLKRLGQTNYYPVAMARQPAPVSMMIETLKC